MYKSALHDVKTREYFCVGHKTKQYKNKTHPEELFTYLDKR